MFKLFINTGGLGKRLYSLTKDIPKPMIIVKGKPMLHHLVDWAKKYDVSEIVMMNGYKAEKIIEYFRNGENFGIAIKHSNEPYPLGSGGPLRYARNNITGTFAYMSGDLICEVDLKEMYNIHTKNNADMTVTLHKSSHPEDSDILQVDENNQIIRFVSKHENHDNVGDLGNAGLCIMEPKIIKLMEEEVFNFENYLYPRVLNAKLKMMGYITEERIKDIGTSERLREIEESDFGVVK
ncbi:MAG: NDP-sugar synthase [Candidatus Pacearchaeota archaeon]|nr:NDP-sugar synthase [Candidatus Pacearchaeota archaeon]